MKIKKLTWYLNPSLTDYSLNYTYRWKYEYQNHKYNHHCKTTTSPTRRCRWSDSADEASSVLVMHSSAWLVWPRRLYPGGAAAVILSHMNDHRPSTRKQHWAILAQCWNRVAWVSYQWAKYSGFFRSHQVDVIADITIRGLIRWFVFHVGSTDVNNVNQLAHVVYSPSIPQCWQSSSAVPLDTLNQTSNPRHGLFFF